MHATTEPRARTVYAAADRHWRIVLATAASLGMSWPLILHGTPDSEVYSFHVFSTVAFARNLVAGVDPWFVPAYGFGIPLPSGGWFLKFPPAVPAALLGVDVLYAVVWLIGWFVFSFYFLKLCGELTPRKVVPAILLVTALFSFSSLGPTYVDDWPEHFLAWALFPMCVWFILRTLRSESSRQRIRAAAACSVVLGVFAGCVHVGNIAVFFSGMAIFLGTLLRTRPKGVLAVGVAMVVAMASTADVLVPAVEGMRDGGVNPLVELVEVPDQEASSLTLSSYGVFFEPALSFFTGGLDQALGDHYRRVQFFGLAGLVLAVIGAVQPFRTRAPMHLLPNDIARSIAVGFGVFTALTLLPPWVMLNLPRMYMYRDGQAVFGLLCAAMALRRLQGARSRWFVPVLAAQVLQITFVGAPIVSRVALSDDNPRLYGYARHERTFFDALRMSGVDEESRILLAGELDASIRGGLLTEGISMGTDFALAGLPLVNAWYKGGGTPMLGGGSNGRHGTYDTQISWIRNRNLQRLTPLGLDVLGITHVALFEDDLDEIALTDGLTPVIQNALPGLRVFRNDDAWTRAVLLTPGEIVDPPQLADCPLRDVYCRDYDALSRRLAARLQIDVSGSTIHAALPPDHAGGTLFVSAAVGPTRSATVDGQPRDVDLVLGTFGAVAIQPGEQIVVVSMARTRAVMLTLLGVTLLTGCLVVAILPFRRRHDLPPPPTHVKRRPVLARSPISF